MSNKLKVVLYFIDGPKATEKQKDEANVLPFRICFRNLKFIDSSPLEKCDAVMGEVIPRQYQNKPRISDLLKEFNEKQSALSLVQEKADGLPPVANSETSTWPISPAEPAKIFSDKETKQ